MADLSKEQILKNRQAVSTSPFRRYRDYRPGEFICVFADTAAGGEDYCAAQFLSKTYLDVPVVYHAQVIASEMTPILQTELEHIYDVTQVKPIVAYERNNGGIFELERLARLNRNGKYDIYKVKTGIGSREAIKDTPKLGWETNTATRPHMLAQIKDCIDSMSLDIPDKPTVNEMFSFIKVQTSSSWKAQAENGAHDDLIMSLAGAWQLYQTEQPQRITPIETQQDLELDQYGLYS